MVGFSVGEAEMFYLSLCKYIGHAVKMKKYNQNHELTFGKSRQIFKTIIPIKRSVCVKVLTLTKNRSTNFIKEHNRTINIGYYSARYNP